MRPNALTDSVEMERSSQFGAYMQLVQYAEYKIQAFPISTMCGNQCLQTAELAQAPHCLCMNRLIHDRLILKRIS